MCVSVDREERWCEVMEWEGWGGGRGRPGWEIHGERGCGMEDMCRETARG